MALDYRAAQQDDNRTSLRPGNRFALGALCGFLGSCVGTMVAAYLVDQLQIAQLLASPNFVDRHPSLCFSTIGIAAILGCLATGVRRYWFFTGVLAAAGLIFLVMSWLSWVNTGWRG